ncbi:uncharacterized protein LOC128669449 isoform X1 [Plodia interpunctella]|uniref:uncharacterized protein LOC128669449 isoform X1 n=1 Tax=Plodia interpunctella TaxID=58824 RepID=UPI0023678514|nr:uncharacterized protein LOC128669449 isoform X1 [Plodia interpunctella]
MYNSSRVTYFYYSLLLTFIIGLNGTFIDLNQVQNSILQWKNQNLQNVNEIGVGTNGIFDLSDVKNKLLQWKTQKLAAFCPTNGPQLQNLLNIVCSTAQPTNVTLRDGCINCFTRVTSMPEGPQELTDLGACATQYFVNTSYAACATALVALSTSALNVQPSGCFMGYCDFVRCLRRTNSINLITQCTREARTGVNITLDADNVRFFTNVTSCILAKSRCGTYNPITGEPQVPGYSTSGARISNALQFSSTGELRIFAFSATTPVINSFCTSTTNLTQNGWLANDC